MRTFHPDEPADSETDDGSEEGSETTEQPEDMEQADDDDTSEASEEQEAEDVSQEEAEQKRWSSIIAAACEDVSFGSPFTKPEDVLKEPYLSDLVSAMSNFVEQRLQFAREMESDDSLYEQINNRIDRLENDDFPRDEAAMTAWHDKRYHVRKILADHLDVIQQEMFDDSDEDDNEDDNNMDIENMRS